MLSKDNFSKEHIIQIHERNGSNPALLERTIYAFGLLEAIRRVDMPFIFKGGTSLLLLLDRPRRLSTDIDIIVEPGTDINSYINAAGKIFPFEAVEEDIRIGANKTPKCHYKFQYSSPYSGKIFHILLDVVFEENPYSTLVEKKIENDMLLTEGKNLSVRIPGVNCILGDKLTAFAPHTTGIKFGIGKELEVIKQMYDCYTLFPRMDDFGEVRRVYKNVVRKELAYRGLNYDEKEVLADTIRSCLCIMGRGSINSLEYPLYSDGITRIQNHIFSETLNGENAGICACSILYLVATILSGEKTCNVLTESDIDDTKTLKIKNARRISYIKNVEPVAYEYLMRAYELLGDKYFLLD